MGGLPDPMQKVWKKFLEPFLFKSLFFQMVGGGWFLPCLSNWVSLFCLYPRNRLSHRAGIGPVLKLRQLSFRWDQPQLCSFIRLGVMAKNIIYTTNVPYLDNNHCLYLLFCLYFENELSYRTGIGPKWKPSI